MNEIPITSVKKKNTVLTEQVADRIAQYVIDNHLNPGDKLPTETELCDLTGVGRGTLREAVKLLISRNILTIERGKGTYVAKHPGVVDDPWGFAFIHDKYRLAKDLWEMRLIVEPSVAAFAAERATQEQISELKDLCDEIEKVIAKSQPHEELDISFHKHIAEMANNQVAQHIVPLFNYGVRMFVEITQYHLLEETILTHREIVNAIAHHNKEEAFNAMKKHLTMNIEYIQNSNNIATE